MNFLYFEKIRKPKNKIYILYIFSDIFLSALVLKVKHIGIKHICFMIYLIEKIKEIKHTNFLKFK